jgi:hypothetical protein
MPVLCIFLVPTNIAFAVFLRRGNVPFLREIILVHFSNAIIFFIDYKNMPLYMYQLRKSVIINNENNVLL